MEDFQASDRRIVLLADLFIGVLAVLCVWLIFLIFAGYGTIRLNLPANTTVRINGHVVTARTLQLRPGNYQIIVSSPVITPYQGTIQAGLFGVNNYTPHLNQRNPNAIASSVLGGDGQFGSLQLGLVQWFNNNSWVVGLITPGGADLAMRYNSTQNQWLVGFYDEPGYTYNLTTLPANVAAYIEHLEVEHAQG